MGAFNLRYFLWFVAVIGLGILLIVLIVGSNKHTTIQSGIPLANYASTGTVVRMTIDGPEVADKYHLAVQVTVGQNSVTYEQLTGYNGHVSYEQTFPNNQAAYEVFLKALYYAGFTLGNNSPALSDERGICPLNNRYIFDIINENGDDIQHLWSTDCAGTKTFDGNTTSVMSLFENQVPYYTTLYSNYGI